MTTTRAIQTMYAGTLFRSRLEARWAVFFDELGISWEFEPEGFIVGLTDDNPEVDLSAHYLPDFYLPKTETWVEVKGSEEHLDRDLLCKALDWGVGLPGTEDSMGSDRGLLILGPIPRPGSVWLHPLLQHRKGVWRNSVNFEEGGFHRSVDNVTFWSGDWFGDGSAGCSYEGPLLEPYEIPEVDVRATSAAYSAARSARFEYDRREVWAR